MKPFNNSDPLRFVDFAVMIVVSIFVSACAPLKTTDGQPTKQIGWDVSFDGACFQYEGSRHPPVVSGESLYFSSGDGAVYAFNTRDGKQQWKFQTGTGLSELSRLPPIVRGPKSGSVSGAVVEHLESTATCKNRPPEEQRNAKRAIVANPIVYDKTLYVGSKDRYFYALDASTGAPKWTFRAGFSIDGDAIFYNGKIIFPTGRETWCSSSFVGDGLIHALDAANGRKIWAFDTQRQVPVERKRPSIKPVLANGIVYATNETTVDAQRTSSLFAIDANTGRQKWVAKVPGHYPSPPQAFDNIVFWSVIVEGRRQLFAVDMTTGQAKWAFNPRGLISDQIIIGHGFVYAASEARTLYALDKKTGKIAWQRELDVTPSKPVSLVVSRRFLYVRNVNYVFAIDPESGKDAWVYKTGHSYVFHGPIGLVDVSVFDGVVYLPFKDPDMLVALDEATGNKLWTFKATKFRNLKVEVNPICAGMAKAGGQLFFATWLPSGWVNLSQPRPPGRLFSINAVTGTQ